jgi:glyoxylase-like metal-dependent hydrolase (beta-lactamase superfamily II)
MKGLPILKVVVTHMHPDHMGLAHWLCEQFNAPLYMNATEYQAALLASTGASNFGGLSTQKFFADHGWNDPADQKQIQSRVSYYANMVPKVPESYHRLMEGSQIQIGGNTWECISGWGHSPEHMALYSRKCQCTHQWRHGLAQNFYQRKRLCPRARSQCFGFVHAVVEKI